nr:isoaspartyl peptidase/L-asparaginase [uncultured Sphingomonas sp.]
MTRAVLALAALLATASPAAAAKWSLVIHGGAGTIERSKLTPEKDKEIRAALTQALDAGSKVLSGGGSSLDAVTAAISVLEDNPNFNAGRGAVFTWEGTNSLDSSIMRGDTRAAGAVAGVSRTRHPVLLAKAVMEQSPHVLLSGAGADQFSKERGLEQVDPSFFFTQERFNQLQAFKDSVAAGKPMSQLEVDHKYGTVGAVALDEQGHIAAATSTGGTTGKRWGRIGDSPIIGAGTYADDRACGVSATGDGEYFIRAGVAAQICTRLRIARDVRAARAKGHAYDVTAVPNAAASKAVHLPVAVTQKVADQVLGEVKALGGTGGVIVMTPEGDALFSFNTAGMYRGRASSDGKAEVAIYGDEK